jgi:WD40 repeat protein
VAESGGTVHWFDLTRQRPNQVDRIHRRTVLWIAQSADGSRIVTCGEDGQAVVRAAGVEEPLWIFTGHTHREIGAAGFLDGGEEVVSATFPLTNDVPELFVWSVADGTVRLRLTGHTQRITGLAVSPDGSRFATSSHDRTVRIWDARTGEEVRKFAEHGGPVACVAWSPDGRWLLSSSGQVRAEDPANSELLLWDSETGAVRHRLRGHYERVTTAAFAPDGSRAFTSGHDGNLNVWDVETGREVLVLRASGVVRPELRASFTVAVSGDGHRVAIGHLDGAVRVYDGE